MKPGMLFPVLLAALASLASAQIAFDPAVTLAAGSQPEQVACADLDGDGDVDFGVTIDAPDQIQVFLNDGLGNFTPGTPIFTGAGTSPHALAAADMTGDGLADFVVTLKGLNQVRVYTNLGGTFVAGASASTGDDPRFITLGDLDGDGDLDVVTGNRNAATASVVRNDGATLTNVQTIAQSQETRGLTAADLDGDGDLDLAICDHDARFVGIYLNGGAASFTPGATLSTGIQLRPDDVKAGDLDLDGDLDLAVTASGGGLNTVSIWTNTGGVFNGPTSFNSGGLNPGALVLADFDGDGDLDAATDNEDSNNVGVLTNTGGSFAAALTFGVGLNPQHIAALDADGNGSPDLLTPNQDANSVSYLRNQSMGTPPAMVDQTLLGPAQVGMNVTLRCRSTADPLKAYLCGFSGDGVNGVLLGDGRTFPIALDAIFQISTTPGNPIFFNTIGAMNAVGESFVTIAVPNVPVLAGASIYSAFLTFDPAASLGIANISTPATTITFVP